jgi:hypothetical protein
MMVGNSWMLLPGGAVVVMVIVAFESRSCFGQGRVMEHAINFWVHCLVWSRYGVVVLGPLRSIVGVLTLRLTVFCIFSLVRIAV